MIRSIFGFFGSGSPSAAQAYIADRTTREERTSGVAAIGAAFGMGTIIGPGFAAVLAAVHLLAPFFAVAIFALCGALAIALFLPERQKPAATSKHTPPLKITDKRIRLFLFLGVTVSTIGAAVMQVAAFFVMDTMHLTGQETAQVVGVGMMGMAMATLFAQLVIIPRTRCIGACAFGDGHSYHHARYFFLVIPDYEHGAVYRFHDAARAWLRVDATGCRGRRVAGGRAGRAGLRGRFQFIDSGCRFCFCAGGFNAALSLFAYRAILGRFCFVSSDAVGHALQATRCHGSTDWTVERLKKR